MTARPKASQAPAPAPRPEEERPPAPWGSFPLVELAVLLGLILLAVGFFVQGPQGVPLIAVGVAIGSAAGLELSVREHFAGYRSHTILLAGSAAVVSIGLLYFLAGLILAICLAVGAVVFVAAVIALRRAFQNASGGLSYKIGGLRG